MITLRFAPGARAVFTRRSGGVSHPPYGGPNGHGLNLGDHVGDRIESVIENRRRLAADLAAEPVWMSQVHGTRVVMAASQAATEPAPEADAIVVVRNGGLAPAVLVADCVPVLLASESGDVRAAVHVGRRGLVLGVLGEALAQIRRYTAEPLYGVIGPHICAGCYGVGEDLRDEAARFGAASTTRWGTPSIDLAAGVRLQLGDVRLSEASLCTFEESDLYSYRRDGVTGRCAGVVLADTPQ